MRGHHIRYAFPIQVTTLCIKLVICKQTILLIHEHFQLALTYLLAKSVGGADLRVQNLVGIIGGRQSHLLLNL